MSILHHSFPWAQGLPSNWVIQFATVGKLGYVSKAPGTIGSALGMIWFLVFFFPTSIFGYVILLGVSLYFAMGLCQEAENRLFQRDPGEIILDEFVAMPVCFLGLQFYWSNWTLFWISVGLGFVYFRFFDIAKPLGIRRLQELPGGFGVVLDDVAAALATNLSLQATYWLAVSAGIL